HPLHHDGLAIETPIGLSEILICLLLKISPNDLRSFCLNKSYFDLWIGITCLGVTGFLQITVLPFGNIDREHGDLCVIETHKSKLLATRRPPERFIVCPAT